jgi:uncharacterized membrane protein YedE/YeeE
MGLLIGYLAQRSSFCSVGGFRDLLLFKQTRVFLGYISLIVGGFLGYLIFAQISPDAFPGFFWMATKDPVLTAIPGAPAASVNGVVVLAIIGGIGLGLLGTVLGGCPLRQLILASEGNFKGWFFLIGMCVGAIVFHLWIGSWLAATFQF